MPPIQEYSIPLVLSSNWPQVPVLLYSGSLMKLKQLSKCHNHVWLHLNFKKLGIYGVFLLEDTPCQMKMDFILVFFRIFTLHDRTTDMKMNYVQLSLLWTVQLYIGPALQSDIFQEKLETDIQRQICYKENLGTRK